jgi:hypothetical protein
MAYLLGMAAKENPHAEADAGMSLLKTQALNKTSVGAQNYSVMHGVPRYKVG